MSFATQHKWFSLVYSLVVSLVFVIMPLEQSSSFVPSTLLSHGSGQDHGSFLIPSQVTMRASARESPSSSSSTKLPPLQLIPSQIKSTANKQTQQHNTRRKMTETSRNNTTLIASFTEKQGDESCSNGATKQKRKRSKRRRRKHMKKQGDNDTRKRRILMGNLPDIHWYVAQCECFVIGSSCSSCMCIRRAVPMDHLRLHPLFSNLPPPESITRLDSLEDVCMFTQESWQWDALHHGRCTTSKAASALGLLEPRAGHALHIPVSWRRGGTSAYYRLRQTPLDTLEKMNTVLCNNGKTMDVMIQPPRIHDESEQSLVWVIPAPRNNGSACFPFAAKYMIKMTPEERARRKEQAMQYAANDGLSVRMSWGNAQEATSLLTALNYFWKQDPGVRLQEVGMCGAGLSSNQTGSVLVGASPDAILRHSNGTIEALEVKNHCPFVPASFVDEYDECSPNYAVRQMPFRNPTVPPLYVPQLMMEMLCIGHECRSAIMVRQTATNGAVIMRMKRDDEWIDEMMYWLNRFQQDYVEKEIEPPVDFFWKDNDESDRYQRFVARTRELSNNVQVLDIVKHHEIQRVVATSRNITSLFLD